METCSAIIDPRKPGEPLWPAMFPITELESARSTLGPSRFAAMYGGDPRDAEGTEWGEEYFEGIYYQQLPPELPIRFRLITFDPSMGKNAKTGDFPALAYALVDSQAPYHVWVEDSFMRVAPLIVAENQAVAFLQEHSPDAMMIETNGFQECVAKDVIRLAAAQCIQAPIWGRNSVENKEVDIRMRLSPWICQRRLHFRDTPHNRLIVSQLRDFPNGDHDDGPDALRLVFYALASLLGARTSGGTKMQVKQ